LELFLLWMRTGQFAGRSVKLPRVDLALVTKRAIIQTMEPAAEKNGRVKTAKTSLTRDEIDAIGTLLAALAGVLQHLDDLRFRRVFPYRLLESGIISVLLRLVALAVGFSQRTRTHAAAAAHSAALDHLRRPPQSCAAP